MICLRSQGVSLLDMEIRAGIQQQQSQMYLEQGHRCGRRNRYFQKDRVFIASVSLKVKVVLISNKFREGIQSSISFMWYLLFLICFTDSVVLSNSGKINPFETDN